MNALYGILPHSMLCVVSQVTNKSYALVCIEQGAQIKLAGVRAEKTEIR